MTSLLLIPTAGEREILQPRLLEWLETGPNPTWHVELCGFGPIAAAASTARLLLQHPVSQVILLGIAGRYTTELEIGAAYQFETVTQYGIGVGGGADYQSMGDLGWKPLQSMAELKTVDSFPLAAPAAFPPAHRAGRLLTVCSAAAGDQDRRQRMAKYPDAVAEDMEGYAVAMACHVAGVPLQIIRGISNDVGDRNHAHWQIQPALQAAMALLRSGT